MRLLKLAFLLGIIQFSAGVATAEITIIDADVAYSPHFQAISITTDELPYSSVYVQGADTVSSPSFRAISITTAEIPYSSVYVQGADTVSSPPFEAISITTDELPYSSVYIQDADTVSSLPFSSVTIDTAEIPYSSVYVQGADTVQTTGLIEPGVQLESIGNQMVSANEVLELTIHATSELYGDDIEYSVADMPAGATFDESTATFRWTPGTSQKGVYYVTFTATAGTSTDSEIVRISVPFGFIVDKDDPEYLLSERVSSGGSYPAGSKVTIVLHPDAEGMSEVYNIILEASDGGEIGAYSVNPLTTTELIVDIPTNCALGDCYVYENEGKLRGDHFQVTIATPEFVSAAIPLLISALGFIYMRRKQDYK